MKLFFVFFILTMEEIPASLITQAFLSNNGAYAIQLKKYPSVYEDILTNFINHQLANVFKEVKLPNNIILSHFDFIKSLEFLKLIDKYFLIDDLFNKVFTELEFHISIKGLIEQMKWEIEMNNYIGFHNIFRYLLYRYFEKLPSNHLVILIFHTDEWEKLNDVDIDTHILEGITEYALKHNKPRILKASLPRQFKRSPLNWEKCQLIRCIPFEPHLSYPDNFSDDIIDLLVKYVHKGTPFPFISPEKLINYCLHKGTDEYNGYILSIYSGEFRFFLETQEIKEIKPSLDKIFEGNPFFNIKGCELIIKTINNNRFNDKYEKRKSELIQFLKKKEGTKELIAQCFPEHT